MTRDAGGIQPPDRLDHGGVIALSGRLIELERRQSHRLGLLEPVPGLSTGNLARGLPATHLAVRERASVVRASRHSHLRNSLDD